MKHKHSLRDWLTAVRPWSFPASAMPVVATLGYLFAMHDDVDWVNGVWALVNIIVFHAAGNTWSDYFDYKREVDAGDTFGVRTLTAGQFTPKEIYRLSVSLLAVALLGGVGLLLRTGLPLLYIGIGGLLCSVLYPPLKYKACGDYVIFMAYALLPTIGTVYATTLHFDWRVLYLAVPIGLITVAILHCNNLRDIRTDSRAGIRTFAMEIGPKASVLIYCLEVLMPFIWIAVCVVCGAIPVWCMLSWIAAVPAVRNASVSVRYLGDGASSISGLDEATAKLQMAFSLLLTAGLVVSGVISMVETATF